MQLLKFGYRLHRNRFILVKVTNEPTCGSHVQRHVIDFEHRQKGNEHVNRDAISSPYSVKRNSTASASGYTSHVQCSKPVLQPPMKFVHHQVLGDTSKERMRKKGAK